MTDSALAVSMSPGWRDVVLEPLAEVSRRNDLDVLALRLLELRDWLQDDLGDLEEAIASVEDGAGSPHLGRQAALHLMRRPGKRVRPLCVILAARLGGVPMNRSVRDLAVACEVVHAATLLHDDVIDEGLERRGAEAARVRFGNSASVLGGDHLLIEALRLVEETQRRLPPEGPRLPSMLDTISQMVAAEALQLEHCGRFDPSREAYLEVICGKTAVMFQWGLEAGGVLAGLNEQARGCLARAGLAMGTAFQLVDDVLDLDGDPAVIGKDVLVDLREGKLTWPFILAAERDPGFVDLVSSVVARPEGPTPQEAAWIVGCVRETGALDDTRRFAARRGEAARAELRQLPEGQARESLEILLDAIIGRSR
jgi:octaprenyl-diphosphate synthase